MWISMDSIETTLPVRMWVNKPRRNSRYGGVVLDSAKESGSVVFESPLAVEILGREIQPGECVEVITSEVPA